MGPQQLDNRNRHLRKVPGPNKLIIDGTYGINATHFSISEIDIFSDHFYPLNLTKLNNDISSVATANRVYLAGEYDWTGNVPTPTLSQFYAVIEAAQKKAKPVIAGDLSGVCSCMTCLIATGSSTIRMGLSCSMGIRSTRSRIIPRLRLSGIISLPCANESAGNRGRIVFARGGVSGAVAGFCVRLVDGDV